MHPRHEERGRIVLMPGSDLSLRQIAGWTGCLLFARVRSLGSGTNPVRFRAMRESMGSRSTAAHGVLFATPVGWSGQPITVRDESELIDLRVSLRLGADPVEIEWIAKEPDHPPAASAAWGYDLLPVGASGAATTPRTDAWGRSLVALAPPQSTFHVRHTIPDSDPYEAPLLAPSEIFDLLTALPGDKLAGTIAITDVVIRGANAQAVLLKNTTLAVRGHPELWVETDPNLTYARWDAPVATPPLFRFDTVLGFYPTIGTGGGAYVDPQTVDVFGYVLLEGANGEGV
jgi:hypothetical protein